MFDSAFASQCRFFLLVNLAMCKRFFGSNCSAPHTAPHTRKIAPAIARRRKQTKSKCRIKQTTRLPSTTKKKPSTILCSKNARSTAQIIRVEQRVVGEVGKQWIGVLRQHQGFRWNIERFAVETTVSKVWNELRHVDIGQKSNFE